MKLTASVEMDENKSSGKSRFTCEMFSIVSCFEEPANGAHPVSMTYANTPTLLQPTPQHSCSRHVMSFAVVMIQSYIASHRFIKLTVKVWWTNGTTAWVSRLTIRWNVADATPRLSNTDQVIQITAPLFITHDNLTSDKMWHAVSRWKVQPGRK